MKPVHEWTEVVNMPYEQAPKLPPAPAKPPPLVPDEPARPLGATGRELWDRAWRSSHLPPDVDRLLQLCEQQDERVALRVRVLRDNDWRDRAALRVLDSQIAHGLVALANTFGDAAPPRWPAATRRWWRAVSRLPHAALWSEGDWQFALDTAQLVAAFHNGDFRQSQEIRRRERVMGTTADARRDLRIRYVDPVADVHDPSVSVMADYRSKVTES